MGYVFDHFGSGYLALGLTVRWKYFTQEKILLETKLESKSFEPLIRFLAFLVQKLWPKSHTTGNFTLTLNTLRAGIRYYRTLISA